jgi:ABC-type nitrate/sulfonate/bicarbonate transport system permease component
VEANEQVSTPIASEQTMSIARSGTSVRKRASAVGRALVVPAALIALWVGLTQGHVVDPIFLPPPETVAQRAEALGPTLLSALRISLQMVFAGLVIGVISGIGAGLLFGYSKTARDLFELTLDTIRPVPLFALIPLFILWFGIGARPQIALVALGVFLILSFTTIEAVRNVPRIYVRAALTCGANRFQIYRTVVFPAILPELIIGVRYGAIAAWGLDVAAEFSGSQEGLGYIMIVRGEYLDTAGITLIVLIFCFLAIVLDRLLRFLGRFFMKWNPRVSEKGFIAEMLGGSG